MSDVRFSRIDEILKHVEEYAQKYFEKLRYLGVEKNDFVQDVVRNILVRKGLDNYDETKTRSFQHLIWNCAKRHMIDLHRSKFGAKSRQDVDGNPLTFVSLDEAIGESDDGDCFTLHEVIEDQKEDMRRFILELSEYVPDKQISPNYDLSWKDLFFKTTEMGPGDIAKEVGISESRIFQLQREIFERFLPKKVLSGLVSHVGEDNTSPLTVGPQVKASQPCTARVDGEDSKEKLCLTQPDLTTSESSLDYYVVQ